MSYYGYVERENASQINWAEVGENLTGVLKKASDDRQAKRNAFDQSTKEFQDVLNKAPSGDFKTANAFALNHASDASKTRLLQDRLLKSGLMKDRDYTVARQNLVDGTKQMFGLSEEYQKEYAEKMERLEAGKSQVLESWLMEQIEGLGNLTDVKSFINQEDGSVSIGKLVDGRNGTRVLSKNPNDFLTVNQLRNRYKKQYDKFKVGDTMAVEADRLGSFINTIRNAGGPEYAGQITKMLDATLRGTLDKNQKKAVDNFNRMEKNMINSYLESNPLNALSVLTNYLGVNPNTGINFEITFDAAEAAGDPNKLLVKDNGSGTIEFAGTEGQKKIAFEAVQNNFRNQIDREKTISTYTEPKPSATQINQDNKEAQETQVVTNIAQLYYGTDAQVQEAEDYLRGINTNIDTIDRTGENIIVTFNDDRADEIIPFRDDSGKELPQAAWITGSANFFLGDKQKITDIDKIIGLSKIDTSLAFNPDSTGFSAGVKKRKETAMEAIMRGLSADIPDNHTAYAKLITDKKDANGKFVEDYKDKIPAGFTLEEKYKTNPKEDKIVSIGRKGKDSIEVDITKPDAVEKILNFIKNNIDLVSEDSTDVNLLTQYIPGEVSIKQEGRGKTNNPGELDE
ncbi:MAG: hypothetical protein GOVbin225_29 [Prokaryotic dsDNA virus sp.]|nr:MAG: hypothetical protein GOVbin225_29 [Prokaryotic dsDNA virus sp.]|tara:strand:+ start:8997 stop:10874 length:1878 start_codon:yes stop_codon:yes gene_type:complete